MLWYRRDMKGKNLMEKPLTPLQWGSAQTHSTNVSLVRHIKATVGCRKAPKKYYLQKHNLATTAFPKKRGPSCDAVSGTCRKPQPTRHTPPTGQRSQVRSLVSRRLWYFFLSVSVLSVSWSATATKKQ